MGFMFRPSYLAPKVCCTGSGSPARRAGGGHAPTRAVGCPSLASLAGAKGSRGGEHATGLGKICTWAASLQLLRRPVAGGSSTGAFASRYTASSGEGRGRTPASSACSSNRTANGSGAAANRGSPYARRERHGLDPPVAGRGPEPCRPRRRGQDCVWAGPMSGSGRQSPDSKIRRVTPLIRVPF